MTEKEKKIVKKELKKYLLSVLAEEEYYNTLKHCKAEALRVNSWEFKRGLSLRRCCADWLRGLPIGVEFATYKICTMIFDWLGWSYDNFFSLGEFYVGDRKMDTYDIDNFYWNTLGEIIAEG